MKLGRNTPFVGRALEIERVSALLAAKAPLVTLLGPGGIGKTRLAREIAARRRGNSTFLDLASARTLDDVLFSLAHALGTSSMGLRGANARLEQIVRAVSFQPDTLLLLDNLEQVVEPARQVVEGLLRARVPILATSREPLRLAEEHCVLVTALPLQEGAALYRQRAEAIAGRPVPDTDAVVTELVRALDGHPLSLELAAARAVVLSASELLALHEQRLDLLSTPDEGRHGSLRRCLDWTWQLLAPAERAALARLTVLRGSFLRDAAAAVLDRSPLETLGLLQSLCERSVLVSEPGVPTRFRLLEGVRAHAAEHLSPEDERAAQQGWREHVAARALQLVSADPVPHADIAAEAGDLRALARDALATPRQRAQAATALALSEDVALGERRELVRASAEADLAGDLADDVTYASGLVALAAGEPEVARSTLRRVAAGANSPQRRLRAQLALAQLNLELEPAKVATTLASALANARQLEVPGLVFEARVLAARAARRLGRLDEAREQIGVALASLQTHPQLLAAPAHLVAAEIACERQQPEEAHKELDQAMAAAHKLSRRDQARLSWATGRLKVLLGDAQGALAPTIEAARSLDALGAQAEAAQAQHTLATLYHVLGELEEAKVALEEAERASPPEQRELRELLRWHRASLEADQDAGLDEDLPEEGVDPLLARGYRAHIVLARARAAAREGEPPEIHLEEVESAREALARAGHAVDAARLASALDRTRSRLQDRVLRVGPGAQWFALSEGAPIDLSRKGAHARVLQSIVEAHAQDPASRLGIEALASAGWPGERIVYRAARDRVYNVIATLRRLGIRDAIVHSDEGYGIHPQFRVERQP